MSKEGICVYTYTVAVAGSEQIQKADCAIAIYLCSHPEASVDDALDAIFAAGVAVYIASTVQAVKPIPNEVCL